MRAPHIAVDRGNVEIARALIAAGASVDPINVFGNAPLWVAVMKRRRPCPAGAMILLLLLLLEHGADQTVVGVRSPPWALLSESPGCQRT
jgi:ankyrin repeat protein